MKSKLSYGCHRWFPSSSEMSKLLAVCNRFLRANGFKRMKPVCLSEDYLSSNLVNVTTESQKKKYQITETINTWGFSTIATT